MLAGGTLGTSEMGIASVNYAITGDGDAFRESMFGVALSNGTAALGMKALGGANPQVNAAISPETMAGLRRWMFPQADGATSTGGAARIANALESDIGAAGEGVPIQFRPKGGVFNEINGGKYVQRDHVPSQWTLKQLGIDPQTSPARQMLTPDHMETQNWGSGAGPSAARAMELSRATSGQWRQIFADAIRDSRKIKDSFYNEANKQMLDAARKKGWLKK